MNMKLNIKTALGLGCLILSGCFDDLSTVGTTIQPDSDIVTVYADTFQMTASTVKIDSLYAKTISGYLGKVYDPLYGRLESDYLNQFYCEENYQFYQTPYEGKIDSIYLDLAYTGWTGDPYAPMQIQVYPLNKPLDKVYYTHVNPEDYYDRQNLLGSLAYTASNGTIVDSIQISETGYMYEYSLKVRLPHQLGQKIYDETVNNPSSFKDQAAFNQFFPGIYVTTGYGNGTILHIAETKMIIAYRYAVESSTGEDSLLYATERFSVSKDVIQLNRFQDSDTEQLLADNDDYAFLKTPAGIFTRIVIPAKEIAPKVEGHIINSLILNFKYMPQEDWQYALTPPPYLVLMPEDSLRSFFENSNIENSVTTYLSGSGYTTGYDASSRTYPFSNVANLLNYHIINAPGEDLRLLLVPVSRETREVSYSGSVYYYTTALNHYLAPSGLKLRKDKDFMKIVVLSSQYTGK
jgi:hypothetical protein